MENTAKPTVFLVDDEDTFREGLGQLLRAAGLNVLCFANAIEFLESYSAEQTGCLVLDLDMPEMTGLELQRQLREKKIQIPIIFITGHGDIPKSVEALKAGAIDFIEKPFRKETLLERIEEALVEDIKIRSKAAVDAVIIKRFEGLSDRLLDVLKLLVMGHSNKEIAEKLDISPRTVEIHRKKIMEKMKAKSLPELVKMASICGVELPFQ